MRLPVKIVLLFLAAYTVSKTAALNSEDDVIEQSLWQDAEGTAETKESSGQRLQSLLSYVKRFWEPVGLDPQSAESDQVSVPNSSDKQDSVLQAESLLHELPRDSSTWADIRTINIDQEVDNSAKSQRQQRDLQFLDVGIVL